MSYIIVGDVHGCKKELMELLDTYGQNRVPVFVGDLVDKGPSPHSCLEIAKLMNSWVIKGNHEENHLRFAKHEVKRLRTGKKNPMKRDADFRETHKKIMSSPLDLIAWMKTFPNFLRIRTYDERACETREVVVVHGGLLPGKAPEDMDPKKMCRVRNIHRDGKFANLDEVRADPSLPFWTELYDGTADVVYGHAPRREPRIDTNSKGATCYGIDTSCVYGGRLTALLLPEFTLVSVKARKTYYVQKW